MTDSKSLSLLVPIGVEALVVNQADQHSTTWSIGHKNYTGLEKFEPVEPPPFIRGNDWPRLGVTLQWALPDGLTQGREEEGKLVFPFIPNRWLIVRTAVAPQHSFKAWIVESDYLGPDGSNIYPNPADNNRSATKIGRSWQIEDWTADREENVPYLTALGPGDVTFTAYIANIDNVLSFYDSLEDLNLYDPDADRDDPATLSYLVVGWYANPEKADPLAFGEDGWQTEMEWRSLLNHFKWSVGDEHDLQQAIVDALGEPTAEAQQNYPSRTVCHGMVFGVNWNGRFQGSAQTGPLSLKNKASNRDPELREAEFQPKRAELPQVAIGNSAIDALAALMEYLLEMENEPVDISTLLQAVEYDLVTTYDEPGGQIELDQRIHQEWFATRSGGTWWEVASPQKESQAGQSDLEAATGPELTAEEQAEAEAQLLAIHDKLDELNAAQKDLDQFMRELASLQWELYALWWKSRRFPFLVDQAVGITLEELNNQRDEKKEQVREKAGEVASKQGERDGFKTELEGLLTTYIGKPLQLMENSAPRFYLPNDPVVLIYGLQRSAKHGEDGRFAADDTLFVRFSGQTIFSFKPAEESDSTIGAANFADEWQPIRDQVDSGLVPAVVLDLLLEAQLLDMAQTLFLATLTEGRPAANILARQQMIWGDYSQSAVSIAAMTRAAGFRGVRPSPIAVEKWQPPWTPLYFCWRVTWYPTSPKPLEARDAWSFNGLDYEWNGHGLIQDEQAVTYQGRTLLTKTATMGMENNLASLFQMIHGEELSAAENATIARLKKALQSADLLSHPLTGFHDKLIMKNPLQAYESDDTEISDLIGNVSRVVPIPFRDGASDSHFYPIRAGHFRLQRLWVVDAYGQVFDPIHERGQTPASFTPIRGSGLVTTGDKQRRDTQVLQLPPRILQASRLQFRFISADPETADQDAGLVAKANPVCGWLLPNHFDNSIAVYDADGIALGVLLLVGSQEHSRLRWDPAVMDLTPVGAPVDIPNPHLRQFVQGLLRQSENAKAFVDLMAAIDSTLWTTDPLGRRKDNLSILIGRPLALVRASLEIQLAETATVDQIWAQTGKERSKSFENVVFPVQLGHVELRDDGTLGYFVEDDYRQFYAVQPTLDLEHPNYIRHQFLSLQIQKQRKVTLVVDPRGSVHARSGIVPTKAIRLPSQYVEKPLSEMDVTFRVGPILNEPRGMRMPIPADIRGGWSWIAHTGVNLWLEEDITAANQIPRLADVPIYLREGWLKLSDALGQEQDDEPEENN